MTKRKYTHVKELLPAIEELLKQGMSQREIAEHYGFKDKFVVKELVKQARKKQDKIPKTRGRKPAKT